MTIANERLHTRRGCIYLGGVRIPEKIIPLFTKLGSQLISFCLLFQLQESLLIRLGDKRRFVVMVSQKKNFYEQKHRLGRFYYIKKEELDSVPIACEFRDSLWNFRSDYYMQGFNPSFHLCHYNLRSITLL